MSSPNHFICPKAGPSLNVFPQTPTLGPARWDPAHAVERQAGSQEQQKELSTQGDHLSNITCLTHGCFNNGESCSNLF